MSTPVLAAIGPQALPVGSGGELEELPVLRGCLRPYGVRGWSSFTSGNRHGAGSVRGYDLTMPEREAVTVELDVEVAAMLREQAAAGDVGLLPGFALTASV